MAGLIAALFGGRTRPVDPDPLPGVGGYALGPGPTGEFGYPGSTSKTRLFKSNNPRQGTGASWTGIKADTNYGFDQALSRQVQTRQASYRGDIKPGEPGKSVASANPRATGQVSTPQPQMTVSMQETPGAFYGGPMLKTGQGNCTAGGELTSKAVQYGGGPNVNSKDTTTLWKNAQPVIGLNTPGSNNVRNEVAQRYKQRPGQTHIYRPAPRADQAGVVPGGQKSDGNTSNERAAQGLVSVPNRFTMLGTGSQTWSVLREMPFGGRGDGARGADLNGTRRYATGQEGQFWNAGQGDYGIDRQRGAGYKRPVGFTEPAPWTANFYDTTESVGTPGSPNSYPAQSPSSVYVSPSSGRASNSTGRLG
jgi:hypothetical protein